MNDRQLYWLMVARKMGLVSLNKAWREVGQIEGVWQQLGLGEVEAGQLKDEVIREMAACQERGVAIVTMEDEQYPELLAQVRDGPPVLYVKGAIELVGRRSVAVVGSRAVSSYGHAVTERLVGGLVEAGVTVVSGMAQGVDSIAHKTALERGGRTVAVLGFGLDKAARRGEQQLAQSIATDGCLLSPFRLGEGAKPYTFPIRNKIIAGMCAITVVVEAAADSGSLLTAADARVYGRAVMAVPGSVFSGNSQGVHQLLKMGANLAVDAADIVDILDGPQGRAGSWVPEVCVELPEVSMTATEQAVVDMVRKEPRSTDELIRQIGVEASTMLSCLGGLELRGRVRKVGETWIVGQ